jgi:hydrogenase maturation protease
MRPAILVAGVGNIFLGDDGFGVEVATALLQQQPAEDVVVRDFGIRGFDLAYALLEPWEAVILVDALPRGGNPGSLYAIQPRLEDLEEAELNPHGMDPVRVLTLAASMGTITARVFVVGCEPEDFGDELEGRMGLSATIEAAVQPACMMVEGLVGRLRAARGMKRERDPFAVTDGEEVKR